jgi:hypothetical protein
MEIKIHCLVQWQKTKIFTSGIDVLLKKLIKLQAFKQKQQSYKLHNNNNNK